MPAALDNVKGQTESKVKQGPGFKHDVKRKKGGKHESRGKKSTKVGTKLRTSRRPWVALQPTMLEVECPRC